MRARAARAAAVLAAVSAVAAEPPPPDAYPKAAASYVVAVDGRILWARDADVPRAPASLAKIMTALVLLEGEWDGESVVTISPRAAGMTGARIGVRAGERMRAKGLLAGMLLRSANDAAVALAEHAAGSVPAFVERMNARAETLGLRETRFANPTGLDAPGQATSARDLLRLTDVALRFPEFARLVATERVTVSTLGGRRIEVETSNALLGRIEGARGVKTGFTSKAGKCVVALAERDGCRVIAVLLDAPDRWWAAAALVEKAFESCGARPAPSS